MHICMCVCMYVCMCVCMYVYVIGEVVLTSAISFSLRFVTAVNKISHQHAAGGLV